MWFKREQKNRTRRTGRGHVLDVRLRSDQVRAMRVRLATIACTVVFGTVFGLYLVWRTGEVLLDKFVYENPDFAIQTVDASSNGVITPGQVRDWSGVRLGMNLIGLDLAAVKRNLELVSAIDSVSIERVLPRTLKIRVTERVPVAQVNVPCLDAAGRLAISVYQLDATGTVMRPLASGLSTVPVLQMYGELPVIQGLDVLQLQPGRRVEPPPVTAVETAQTGQQRRAAQQLQAALQLIEAFRHSPMSGLADLRQLDVSAPGVVTVTTGQGGQITFGLDHLDQQLRRWREIHDLGLRAGRTIASADLAVENNVPVHWLGDSPAPAAPKLVKPVKNRRRNV